jgi:hypothetical protein
MTVRPTATSMSAVIGWLVYFSDLGVGIAGVVWNGSL